jgi:hypothetical protein
MLFRLNINCARGGFDQIEEGIYGNLSGTYRGNFGNWNFDKINYQTFDYGVADNLDQIKAKYKEQIDQKRNKYVIAFDLLKKSSQYEEGGWRWHKWGKYIGTQKPQCEYLYDEPEIEEIVVYTVYKLLGDK